MSDSLYKIASEYLSRLNEVDENTDMEAFTEWLTQSTEELHKKILSVGAYIKNLRSKSESLQGTISELLERQSRIETKSDKIEENLLKAMVLTGVKNVEGIELDVSVRRNKSRVIIDDESLIPEEFISYSEPIPPQKIIDKNFLYKFITSEDEKASEGIPGVHLEDSRSLQIKS